jgi:hypothetical protein
MNGVKARIAAIFFIAVILALPAVAQSPAAEWRTIRTEHFRIHYPAEYEGWAMRAAAHVESVRDAVVREVGYAPHETSDILVMNPIADSNGLTLPLLGHPRIVLFTEPPEPESQIGEFSDWIDLLMTHEMTHLVQLLRPSRNPVQRVISKITGVDPIALYAPRWALEGYATVEEGRITGSGRPNSSLRAAILRKWALSGRLPTYAQLNSDRSFAGMSMAYLGGSAFLEWLQQRGGEDSLRKLWARMTARQRRSFDSAFEGVFGEAPARLYGRFMAELTERAMEIEKAAQPREGELWLETSRGSGDPVVSPDGKRIAIVQRDAHGEAKLVVYSTGPNPEEQKFKERIEKMLKRDPEDVAPVAARPLPRKPEHTLTLPDGGDIATPRWTRDGKSILYSHKQPDREGFLHHDLFLWTPESGANRRVTRLADVEDADPLPDGTTAIGVRNRDGLSQLINVNLFTGEVTLRGEASLDKIFSHPRASASGKIAWAEHDRSGWHLGNVSGAFSPEWLGETLYASVARGGFIDIARIGDGVAYVTRTAGAAMQPAPAPDGSLYFMSLERDGFVVRHLANMEPVAPRAPLETRLAPAIPPVTGASVAFQTQPVAAPREYGFGRPELAGIFGGYWTAYDHDQEIAVRAGDVVGRFDALAIASSKGSALVGTWRGWPVAVTAHAIRHGLELHGEYEVHAPQTLLAVEAGGLAGRGSRGFADASFALHQKNSRETLRLAADSKRHARLSLRLAARAAGLRFAISGEAAKNMTLGGVATSITPDALLIERVLDPALPSGFSVIERYRGVRAELTASGLTAFYRRHADGLNVRGIEWTSRTPPIPLVRAPALDATIGAARVSGIRGTKGWISIRWRP